MSCVDCNSKNCVDCFEVYGTDKQEPRRFEECRICKTKWNVSLFQKVAKKGYICPRCKQSSKGKKKK